MQAARRRFILQTFTLLFVCILIRWNLGSLFPSLSPLKYINSCSKSLLESDNYICESDDLWKERKIIYDNQDKSNMMKRNDSTFFLSNWEPNFHCSHARRIGNMGDGGKWVCDLFRLKKRPDCLIYSAGSSGEFSFETHMKNLMPHCEIHTFDQGVYECPNNICVFHRVTLGNGIIPRKSKTWQMIIKELNHINRPIDILKIDIEGGEYDFFSVLFKSSKSSFPRQILVELHPQDANVIHSFFELLRVNNYVIFNKEANIIAGTEFFEYTFLRLNSLFLNKR